jgi:predicted PurR-regulated permease PerM
MNGDRNTFLGVGLIALVAFGIIVILYYVIDMSADQDVFIDKWEKRIQVANNNNNSTQQQLLNLARNANTIFQQQISNEENILGNLTNHRDVTNLTRDVTFEILNRTLTIEEAAVIAEQGITDIVGNMTALLNNTGNLNNNNDRNSE